MGYARGRFGVEYQPHGNTETHRLRWFVGIVTLLVLAAFTWYRLSHRTPAPKPPREADARAPVAVSAPVGTPTPRARPEAETTARPPAPSAVLTNAPRRTAVRTPPTKQTPQVLRLVGSWLATASTRSEKEQVLLQRLAEAERQGNVPLAIDSLKKLYDRPTMADIRDPLMRRLGDLNVAHLFSGKTTPWTVVVTVKRGDSLNRIAREHRSTPAVVAKLNPRVKWERLQPGDAVRVLDFPNAVLVIYKQLGYADLSLKNGQFFRRYILSIAKSTPCSVYPISPESGATVHARFRELGIRASSPDRAELDLFLAPGSRITVAEQ